MSKSIHVNSIEILMRLNAVLGQFADKSLDTLDVAGNEVKRRLQWIEECCEERQSELDYWSSVYDSADSEEDDMGFLAHKRDDAAEKLMVARRVRQRVEEACENFARQARRVNEISSERIGDARAFLRQKVQELDEYTSFRVASESGISGNEFVGSGQTNSASATHSALSSEEIEIERRIDEAESDWGKAAGRVHSNFSRDFGLFAHERFQEKLRALEKSRGRVEKVHYGVEYPVEHNGRKVRYDYVDLENHLIVEYKPEKKGQIKKVAQRYRRQRLKHAEVYRGKFGVEPSYLYLTYPGSPNMYPADK